MAIKAKLKAKAPGSLFIDFWSIFLVTNQVSSRHYHHKKFNAFMWHLSRFRGVHSGEKHNKIMGRIKRFRGKTTFSLGIQYFYEICHGFKTILKGYYNNTS